MKYGTVIAVKDGFMEDGDQFCIEGKEYPIIDHSQNMYGIKSELAVSPHWLEYNNEWFKVKEVE